METIKGENGIEITIIRDEDGDVIAEIHGKLNIKLIAKFLIKNSKITPKH